MRRSTNRKGDFVFNPPTRELGGLTRMPPKTTAPRTSLPFFLTLLAACGDPAPATDTAGVCDDGGKCDDPTNPGGGAPGDCLALLVDKSGRERDPSETRTDAELVLTNDDPLARLVFAPEPGANEAVCPRSVGDITQRLRDKGCIAEGTAFVSERSQLLKRFTDYRAVTTYRCDEDTVVLHYPLNPTELEAAGITVDQEKQQLSVADGDLTETMAVLLASKFPAMIASGRTPDGKDIINYYQGRRADLRFFGSSLDMLKGTDLETLSDDFDDVGGTLQFTSGGEHEFVARSLDVERNCAACHPGGGMVMKELRAPWIHWDSFIFDSPMIEALVASAADIMGRQMTGDEFEFEVRKSFGATNTSRLQRAAQIAAEQGDATLLLQPLFCAVEFNVMSLFAGELRVTALDGSQFAALDNSPELATRTYNKALRDRGSRLETFRDLGEAFPPDTFETLTRVTFVERAGIDLDFVEKLLAGVDGVPPVVDPELVADIRGVDFTRSVYSQDRCGLLDAVAKHPFGDLTPAGLRAGLQAALANDPSPAAKELLANLAEDATADRLVEAGEAFVNACGARPRTAFAADYVKFLAQQRKRAESVSEGLKAGDSSFAQFFFPLVKGAVMPVDDEPLEVDYRLHPTTCEGTNRFVSRHTPPGQ